MPTHGFRRPAALVSRIVVAVLILVLASCGSKFPKTYPVKGKILVDGKPASECRITFFRQGGPELATPATPSGLTDQSGEFQLSSYGANDGAPEGEYVVTIEWRERSGLMKTEFDGPDQLGGEYSKIEKNKALPGFVVQVKDAVTLPPFELKLSEQAKRKAEADKKKKPKGGGPLGGGD